ncbi:hypothetical protein Pint_32555 [Pistacia integerrima]|uniref:Uncharacterized protein n=1 Tax=Pistacia integerrima TaxID=434235 RepID=A0ACC0XME9_9ROSI|nr:hypothetical protein Pint_32555 [Pistacia integerrima]
MAARDSNIAGRGDLIKNVAIIFGVTGLVGKELARRLISTSKWKVYGVARNPEIKPIQSCNYHFISCDLLDPLEIQKKLSLLRDVTHVFWVTWATEFMFDAQACCIQNKGMMSNALNAILPRAKALKHVSLQTGMKHYVSLQGPFIDKEIRFYSEEYPRPRATQQFYYDLEDLLKEKLAGKVGWSVHRPGVLMGSSCRTFYNFMGSLCVYGSILAEQHIWAATNEEVSSTDGQAFNAINGPRFTWKEIWPSLGLKFGLQVPQNMFLEEFTFTKAMSDKQQVWKEIVEKKGLIETEMEDLANWAFLDILFRCPVKMLGTRDKADRFGFKLKYNTLDSILYWIDSMRDEKLVP